MPGSPPIDSTASVGPNGNLYFGGGNAAAPVDGGYYAYGPNGVEVWNQVVTNPTTDTNSVGGVQASLSLGDGRHAGGGRLARPGDLRAEHLQRVTRRQLAAVLGRQRVLDRGRRRPLRHGDRRLRLRRRVVAGLRLRQALRQRRSAPHLQPDSGGLVCAANTNEEVDSSPAVGPDPPRRRLRHRHRDGQLLRRVSDEDTVKVFDTECNQVWSDKLDGTTGGSPALADVQGNGQLAVVEGTVSGSASGTVYALNAATGAPIWQTNLGGAVYGSVTTADLGTGYQDVIVPTDLGLFVLDGQTGDVVAHVDDGTGGQGTYGFQNAALVTGDANGTIGITVAGYFGVHGGNYVQGIVQHFEVSGSDGALADEGGAWPQFHHDAGLSGFVGGGAPLGAVRPTDRRAERAT